MRLTDQHPADVAIFCVAVDALTDLGSVATRRVCHALVRICGASRPTESRDAKFCRLMVVKHLAALLADDATVDETRAGFVLTLARQCLPIPTRAR